MDGQYDGAWSSTARCDPQVTARGPVREFHLVVEDLGETIPVGEDLAFLTDGLGVTLVSQG
jgi:hypothetical protein